MRSVEILRSRMKKSSNRSFLPAAAALLVWLGLGLAPVGAEEKAEWTVYAGRWGLEKEGTASELGFEVQRPFRETGFNVVGGLAATDDEAVWAYAGASYSWQPGDRWRLRPGFAVSVFENGDGKDLGGAIEFRSSLEATARVRSNLRFGILVYHLSNAGIYDLNPGSNSLVFVVGFP